MYPSSGDRVWRENLCLLQFQRSRDCLYSIAWAHIYRAVSLKTKLKLSEHIEWTIQIFLSHPGQFTIKSFRKKYIKSQFFYIMEHIKDIKVVFESTQKSIDFWKSQTATARWKKCKSLGERRFRQKKIINVNLYRLRTCEIFRCFSFSKSFCMQSIYIIRCVLWRLFPRSKILAMSPAANGIYF